MNTCPVHNIPLTPVGMQLVCLKCNPLHKVTGYIDLRCQRQDYWPFFAIFNVRYWSLMLSAFRHFIITDWRGVFCQHSRFAFFL